jgi:hypothetical protein
MAHYFSYFPKVKYKIDGPNATQEELVTDITKRFKITQLLNGQEAVYYSYTIQDGDRPDIVAEKFYDDSRLDWLVMLPNELHDRYYQWPLSQREFEAFVRKKYGSIATAQSQIKQYEQILSSAQVLNNGTVVPERFVIVDETTYNSLASGSRRILYAYDIEDRVNEKRRNIKLLDPSLASEVVRAARRTFQ